MTISLRAMFDDIGTCPLQKTNNYLNDELNDV